MRFIRKEHNLNKWVDNIFSVSNKAKADKDPSTINATAGCLFDEDGKIASFKSVFNALKELDNSKITSYAQSPKGNSDFLAIMDDFVLEGLINLPHESIATPGGTGAINLAIRNTSNPNDIILLPSIAWPNYKTIAEELNLNIKTYDQYNIDDLLNKIDEMNSKFILIINSPCANPTGHRYSKEEYQLIINKLNNSKNECIFINDVAYIDYASNSKDYFELLNNLNDNVLTLIAYSLSKSFSYYGQRLGVLFTINKDETTVKDINDYFIKTSRASFSNVNNGAMNSITKLLTEHKDEYLKEKEYYKDLLFKRAELFKNEATLNNLEYYDYSDGFFITLKISDDIKDQVHQKLMDNHIYVIKVKEGLRVGLCSTPINKVKGLAKRIKDVIDKTK